MSALEQRIRAMIEAAEPCALYDLASIHYELMEQEKAHADVVDALRTQVAEMAARVVEVSRERDHYKSACLKMADEVTQILGDALYGPTPPDAPGPVWAMHTPETLAVCAADRIARLQATRERVRALCLAGHDAAYDLAGDVLAIIDEGSEG